MRGDTNCWIGWAKRSILIILFFALLLASCTTASTPEPISTPTEPAEPKQGVKDQPTKEDLVENRETIAPEDTLPYLGLTYISPDGNRVVAGSSRTALSSIDIRLQGQPLWVVSAPFQGMSVWYVVLTTGQVQVFHVNGTKVLEQTPDVSSLPAGMPPALAAQKGGVHLLPVTPDASVVTNPVQLGGGTVAYVDDDGNLVLNRSGQFEQLALDVLPDARILIDETGRLLFLSGQSSMYAHGVLGDSLEATAITLVDVNTNPILSQVIEIAAGDVIEGTAPIWVDIDGDGAREIVVTQTNATEGARIVVYREDGSILAQGDPIGQGYRWRHQLAVAQFIPGGAMEIAAVRTPHIGGVVEIYTLEDDRLEVAATLSGYSSHQIGSRNLDSAFAGDMNGDGLVELILPNQAQTGLASIQYAEDGLHVVWSASLGGKLSTNLSAVSLPDGTVAFGAGTSNQILRIWFQD